MLLIGGWELPVRSDFFLSIVIHELTHSLVARYYGISMKGITLFIFGGVAQMEDDPPNPKLNL